MTKRKVYNNHFKDYMQVRYTGHLHVYSSKSATWLYNEERNVVVLFVDDSDGMSNDTIIYWPSSEHYGLHRERIMRLAA